MSQIDQSSTILHAGPSSTNGTLTNPEEATESLTDIRQLLQFVARAFYEVRHILLIDQLVRKEA